MLGKGRMCSMHSITSPNQKSLIDKMWQLFILGKGRIIQYYQYATLFPYVFVGGEVSLH